MPEEKLPISAFDLDEETREVKRSKAQKRCNEIELYLKALIVAQDRQCEVLKEKSWNTMETKGRKLKVCVLHKQYILLGYQYTKMKNFNMAIFHCHISFRNVFAVLGSITFIKITCLIGLHEE